MANWCPCEWCPLHSISRFEWEPFLFMYKRIFNITILFQPLFVQSSPGLVLTLRGSRMSKSGERPVVTSWVVSVVALIPLDWMGTLQLSMKFWAISQIKVFWILQQMDVNSNLCGFRKGLRSAVTVTTFQIADPRESGLEPWMYHENWIRWERSTLLPIFFFPSGHLRCCN